MKKVLCIAEVCCDIIFGGLSKIPVQGEEEYCRDFSVKAGGGANTALGLGWLGVPVRLFTRIGEDMFGRILQEEFEAAGVSVLPQLTKRQQKTGGIEPQEKEIRTAVSAVMSTGEDRCFASYIGSGSKFLGEIQYEQLEEAVRETDHVHTYAGYCMQAPIAGLCAKYHKTFSVDTSWTPGISLNKLAEAISGCAYFTPNEKEAMELTGTVTPEEAVKVLSERIPGTIVTMGERGSLSFTGERMLYQSAVCYGDTVDPTGAGDLYCSGLIYGFVNGADRKEAMRIASHTAGLCVTYYGGMDKQFSLERLNL